MHLDVQKGFSMRFCSESGQSTVEAAVLLPALLVVFGLLLQPAILLYNRCIMNTAAAEACRLVATGSSDDASARAYIERRLKAIPQVPIFHVDETWNIAWSHSDDGTAQVSIENRAQPLPLFGILAGLTNVIDEDGAVIQHVELSCSPTPSWVGEQGYSPSDWIGEWK